MPVYLSSPPRGVWFLGPIPIRAYALCIIAGILVAVWWTRRRWVARGGAADDVLDVATWAVPFGIIGARLYHVITDPEFYFGPGREPIRALYIWGGGLGIWGAVAPNHFLGLRLNEWTSLVVFLAAMTFLLLRRPRRQQPQTATAARQ